jgi:hypothetical protein
VFAKTVMFPRIKKGKAIPVTGRGGLQGWEILRIPHCLDSRARS